MSERERDIFPTQIIDGDRATLLWRAGWTPIFGGVYVGWTSPEGRNYATTDYPFALLNGAIDNADPLIRVLCDRHGHAAYVWECSDCLAESGLTIPRTHAEVNSHITKILGAQL